MVDPNSGHLGTRPVPFELSVSPYGNGMMMEGENHSRYRDTIGECLALPWQWEA
jgi:hypothetical protein